jgi:hypothetical protein
MLKAAIFLFSALLATAAVAAEIKVDGDKTVEVDARKAEKGSGYSVLSSSKDLKILSHTVTCSCSNGTSETKSCPTVYYTCDCTGSSAKLTCN